LVKWKQTYEEALESILNRCFLPSLVPFGQGVSREKICLTLANHKQELLLAATFVVVSFHLANKYGCQEQFLFLIG
jgi:hypothetical protein